MDDPIPHEIHPVAGSDFRALDPRVIPLRRTVGRIVTASVSLGFLAILVPMLLLAPPRSVATLIALALWSAMTVALGVCLHRWPPIAYRHAAYRVDAGGLEIRRGVVWRRGIKVPRSRVQHTEVSQGPLERRHGLGRLGVYTAGTTFALVTLAGLDHGEALALREQLQPRGSGDAV